MAIVMTAVTSPSNTNPPRLLGNDKRNDRNRTLGGSAGGSMSSKRGGGKGKESISNPTYVPHTTTDAFSQKNYKHFPISRPLPVHEQSAVLGSASGKLAGPVINFAHPQRPIISRPGTAGTAGSEVRFPPSNVVRPLRPSQVGAATALQPRHPTTQGVLALPSSSSGGESSVSPQAQQPAGVQRNGSTRRSSGWNRYWSGGSALNMMGFSNNRKSSQAANLDDRTSAYTSQTGTQPSDQDSIYSRDSRGQSRAISDHEAFRPPPLNFGQGSTRMSQVSSGSPNITQPSPSRDFPLQSGRIGHVRGTSDVSSLSSYEEDPIDAFSSGVPTSEPEAQQWNPLAAHEWNGVRGTSSVYTDREFPLPGGGQQHRARADLVDSYYAKSNGGASGEGYESSLKLPKQGTKDEGIKANSGRRRSTHEEAQQYLKPPSQQQHRQQHSRREERHDEFEIPHLVDEYGRPHIYPTHEQQVEQQRQRMNERGDGGAQARYQHQAYQQGAYGHPQQRPPYQQQKRPQQRNGEMRYQGPQYPYPSSRTQHAQRGRPEPRSDDMSWLNLGR